MRRGQRLFVGVLALLVLLLAIRMSGWSPLAPEALPLSPYAPTFADDATTTQTLAYDAFEAAGGSFVWEVQGAPRMSSQGVHGLSYRFHRVAGEPARIWPEAARLLDARDDNVNAGVPGASPSVEGGVLVVRMAYQPRAPGAVDLAAVVELQVVRDLAAGYVHEEPRMLRLEFSLDAAPPAAAVASPANGSTCSCATSALRTA